MKNFMRKANRLLFAIILVCSACASRGLAQEVTKLTFGVVPQQSALKLANNWVPILNYLSAVTGYELVFKTAPDIEEFERRCAKGEYDLGYMNPAHYAMFSRQTGYRAFAKEKNVRIKGIIVVRKDAPYHTVAELAGKAMAFPSPAAFAASVLPRLYLKQAQIDIIPNYVNSHDSVYLSVVKGLYPAGGGIVRTLNSMESGVRDELRILWESPGYTPHAFAAHPRVPDEMVGRIQKAMGLLSEDLTAVSILKAAEFFNGFEPASDSDWDDVRLLGADQEASESRP